jgi:hypothetical protein
MMMDNQFRQLYLYNMKYWIVVVAKDHIARGIEGGFMQANHGKDRPLKRMAANDWVICYSPKQTYAGKEL